jgi:hypothetical protein
MTVLFDRRARLTIGTIEIAFPDPNSSTKQGLRFTFDIERTLTPKPNKASFQVYNFNEEHRKELEGLDAVPVECAAGYADEEPGVLFLGNLRACPSTWTGTDWITQIGAGDGEQAIRTSRVSASFAKTAPTESVLRDLARALGVKEGNLNQAVMKLRAALNTGPFSKGTVLSGSAAREMTRVCRSLDLEWSVQNGALQILPRTQALAGSAIVVSPRTGMIGAPTIDGKGVASFSTLLIKDLAPGRIVVIESKHLTGQFRVEECKYSGDTMSQAWRIDVKAKRY